MWVYLAVEVWLGRRMKNLIALFTPPEWPVWNWAGRIAYVVVFVGIMAPVYWVADKVSVWFGDLLRSWLY